MPTEFQLMAERIEKLSAKAAAVLAKEKRGVINRIKVAIEAYDISPRELFNSPFENPFRVNGAPKSTPFPTTAEAKYSDGKGHTWSGRGPRPQWLRENLDAGRTLEDFLTKKPGGSSTGRSRGPSPQKGTKVLPKYKDSEGNTWTGRGLKPRWLQAAITSGKRLEDFLVSSSKLLSKRVGSSTPKVKPVRRFEDGNGNVWHGRGPRPQWLKFALANGASIKQFDVTGRAEAIEAVQRSVADGKAAAEAANRERQAKGAATSRKRAPKLATKVGARKKAARATGKVAPRKASNPKRTTSPATPQDSE